MSNVAEFGFWTCFALVVYTYFGYPLLLFAVYSVTQIVRDWDHLHRSTDRRVTDLRDDELPGISVIVPAYNEVNRLAEKAENLSKLDYPRSRLEVVFVSDGSTDGSNEVLQRLPRDLFRVVLIPQRKGKANALNHGVAAARHEILILCDTSTILEPKTARRLARHFQDPKVGLVCASLTYRGTTEFEHTEGVYWGFESIMRIMEGRLGATLTASGPLCALRKSAYRPLEQATLIDDFVVAANVRRCGLRLKHDPEVIGIDQAAASVGAEFVRRVRLATGSFRSLPYLLRTPMRGTAFLAFVSHKLLRWLLPFLLIGVLVCSAALAGTHFYRMVLFAQLGFYAWAALGYTLRHQGRRWRFAMLAYFIVSMNAAFAVGFVRALRRSREGTWQRVN